MNNKDKNFILAIPLAKTGEYNNGKDGVAGTTNCAIFRQLIVTDTPRFQITRSLVRGALENPNPSVFYAAGVGGDPLPRLAAWTLSGPGSSHSETRHSFVVLFPFGSSGDEDSPLHYVTIGYHNLFISSFQPHSGTAEASYGGGGIPRPLTSATLTDPLFGMGGISGCGTDLLAVSTPSSGSIEIYKMQANSLSQPKTTLTLMQTIKAAASTNKLYYLFPSSFNWDGTAIAVGISPTAAVPAAAAHHSSSITSACLYVMEDREHGGGISFHATTPLEMPSGMQNIYQLTSIGNGHGVLLLGTPLDGSNTGGLVIALYIYNSRGTAIQVLYHNDEAKPQSYYSYAEFPNLIYPHMLQFGCVSRSGKNIVILRKNNSGKAAVALELFQFVSSSSPNGVITVTPDNHWTSSTHGFVSGTWHHKIVNIPINLTTTTVYTVHIPNVGRDVTQVCGVRFLDAEGTRVGLLVYAQNPEGDSDGAGSDCVVLDYFFTPDTGLNGPTLSSASFQ